MADRHSIQSTTEPERMASAGGVGMIWLAATMTASTLPLGALIATLFPHAAFFWVVAVAAAFFLGVGVLSLPGYRLGIPTMAVSERVFGKGANRLVSLASWFSQIGWQAVVLVLVVFTVRSVLVYTRLVQGPEALYVAIVFSVLANFAVPVAGYGAIVRAQTVSSVMMGLFALYIFLHLGGLPLLAHGHGPVSFLQTAGAISLALMGGALSWTMFASDYSRFIPSRTRSWRVAFWPALGGAAGGSLVLALSFVLYFRGGIALGPSGLSLSAGGMASAPLYLGFCLFAMLGLLASNFLNSYSSAFSLAVFLGRDLDRKWVTVTDAALATGIALYVLFVSPSFLDTFQTFLDLLILVAAPWTGLMLVRVLLGPGISGTGPEPLEGAASVLILVAGIAATAAFSDNPLWTGAGAGLFQDTDLSPLAGFGLAAFLGLACRPLLRAAGNRIPRAVAAEVAGQPGAGE